MTTVIKLKGTEVSLTAASTVGDSRLVRMHNTGTAAIVTQKDSEGTTLGTMTVAADEVVYVEKSPSDTLEGGAAFKCVPVGYGN